MNRFWETISFFTEDDEKIRKRRAIFKTAVLVIFILLVIPIGFYFVRQIHEAMTCWTLCQYLPTSIEKTQCSETDKGNFIALCTMKEWGRVIIMQPLEDQSFLEYIFGRSFSDGDPVEIWGNGIWKLTRKKQRSKD